MPDYKILLFQYSLHTTTNSKEYIVVEKPGLNYNFKISDICTNQIRLRFGEGNSINMH